jgi:hypothetical protein
MCGLQKALVLLLSLSFSLCCVGGGIGVNQCGTEGVGGGSIMKLTTGAWSLLMGSWPTSQMWIGLKLGGLMHPGLNKATGGPGGLGAG